MRQSIARSTRAEKLPASLIGPPPPRGNGARASSRPRRPEVCRQVLPRHPAASLWRRRLFGPPFLAACSPPRVPTIWVPFSSAEFTERNFSLCVSLPNLKLNLIGVGGSRTYIRVRPSSNY